jgi:ATP/maltotriose-dependent transcriptional regulator MalT
MGFVVMTPRAGKPPAAADHRWSAPEIAGQPCLPVNTTKTRMRHLYDKPGAHRRHEAVEQVGALGLLAPPP